MTFVNSNRFCIVDSIVIIRANIRKNYDLSIIAFRFNIFTKEIAKRQYLLSEAILLFSSKLLALYKLNHKRMSEINLFIHNICSVIYCCFKLKKRLHYCSKYI